MSELDPDLCYPALCARDERFDGRHFVGVTSTGVYCRPICPARTPRRDNCCFFRSAAAAQQAGFRPCLRCRPEVAPNVGSWLGTSNTVSRGLALIASGALDGDDASVETLAERLGVGARQLRRLFSQHLGASPVAVAQTRRVLFAKQLLHDTRLPMAEVALAAGFGSIRRFNETFLQLFGRPPGALRSKLVVTLPEGSVRATGVAVRLRYRPPYDWAAMLAFLRARAVDGIEHVDAQTYRRTVLLEGVAGTIDVSHAGALHSLAVTIRVSDVRVLSKIVARVRNLFDLDADIGVIGAHLALDPMLAPLLASRPGLRTPGAWDSFELAMRAVLGQQVTVENGRRLVETLAHTCGTRLSGDSRLRLGFPTAAQVEAADLSALAMPSARRQALVAIAQAALADPRLFEPSQSIEETVAKLRAIRGVGDWTAHYIALRGARESDAFPAGDVALLRQAVGDDGVRPSAAELTARAQRWRPWRAYAAQHLWTADGDTT